jgi:hypothetical protein
VLVRELCEAVARIVHRAGRQKAGENGRGGGEARQDTHGWLPIEPGTDGVWFQALLGRKYE